MKNGLQKPFFVCRIRVVRQNSARFAAPLEKTPLPLCMKSGNRAVMQRRGGFARCALKSSGAVFKRRFGAGRSSAHNPTASAKGDFVFMRTVSHSRTADAKDGFNGRGGTQSAKRSRWKIDGILFSAGGKRVFPPFVASDLVFSIDAYGKRLFPTLFPMRFAFRRVCFCSGDWRGGRQYRNDG